MKSNPAYSGFRPISALLPTCALLFVVPATAADKVVKVPLSIYCFEYAGDLKSVDVPSGKSATRSVGLSSANVIDAGEALSVNGVISLYGPPAEGVENPVVATLETGEIRQPLAVLTPAAEGEKPAYQSHVVDGDVKSFPMGSYLFVNLSAHPVRINYGEHTMEFPPAGDKLFNPKVKGGEVLGVSIEYQVGDEWLKVSSSRWAYRTDRRTVVCIRQDAGTGRLLLKSIPLRK